MKKRTYAFLAICTALLTGLLTQAQAASYIGIGITVQQDRAGHFEIIAVRPKAPAARAGVTPGLWITAVDGRLTSGHSLQEVTNWIQGPVGTPVVLSLMNPETQADLEVSLIREWIEVACFLEGTIHLDYFGNPTTGGSVSGWLGDEYVSWDVFGQQVSGQYKGEWLNLNFDVLGSNYTISGYLHGNYIYWTGLYGHFNGFQECIP